MDCHSAALDSKYTFPVIRLVHMEHAAVGPEIGRIDPVLKLRAEDRETDYSNKTEKCNIFHHSESTAA